MGYTLRVLLKDELGTLARLALLLTQRGIAAESLAARRTREGTLDVVIRVGDGGPAPTWAVRQLQRLPSVVGRPAVQDAGPAPVVLVRLPKSAALPQGAHVVAENAEHRLVACAGDPEALARAAGVSGGEMWLTASPVAPEFVTAFTIHRSERRAIRRGRKVVVRPRR
jgi:hypothetical protein